MRLIYHPEAEAELIEAAQFYEKRVPTLGSQFLDLVDDAIRMIGEAPNRWSLVEGEIRRYGMPRFPYMIYYRCTCEDLRILAFKHHRRHPDYWRDRVAD